ncbi:MAG: helix-turn-helix transcriptional regulator [Lentisphaeria bacterium]|nr:helix-turn-helix transcriptional regulator [Lentisphaeria bacterium]
MADKIKEMLRAGVKKIVSRYSPVSSPEEANFFLASSHRNREIFFVVEGTSRYMLNGNVYDAEPGTLFMIDHWESHAFGYRSEDKNLIHLWINFWASDQISAYLMSVGLNGVYRIFTRRMAFPPEFQMLINRRWDTLNQLQHATQADVMDYMKLPLETLFNEIIFQLDMDESVQKVDVDSMIESLKKYIQTANGRDCSYQRLEQISGYSRYYLAHRFRDYVGCSVGAYIDKVRVAYTVEALHNGLKQKEIAFELGFSSPSNFWLWLQKHREEIQKEEKRLKSSLD